VKFSNKEWFFFCFSLALGGIGILQPINPVFGYILIFIGVVGMISVLIRAAFRRVTVNGKSDLNELSLNELKKWCNAWGKIYDHLNRIVLYVYPPQSQIRYALYFEFDVFTKAGQKQSEVFNQGAWYHEHFPIDDVEEFKSVYNKKPNRSDYINEWDIISNARDANKEAPRSLPPIEIYRKEKSTS
jgi:hypothetical protein